jgi:hypothetical protein
MALSWNEHRYQINNKKLTVSSSNFESISPRITIFIIPNRQHSKIQSGGKKIYVAILIWITLCSDWASENFISAFIQESMYYLCFAMSETN